MVKLPAKEIRRIMENKDNIRNVSIISHVGHGKSTFTDSLVRVAGIDFDQEVARVVLAAGARKCEAERSIRTKSTAISLYHKMTDEALEGDKGERQRNDYLVNLIDTPGRSDFSSEVTVALRIADGVLVIVDSTKGICFQTEALLRQAMAEMIQPVLILNKIDKWFLEDDGEKAYQAFQKVIDEANIILGTYESDSLGDLQVFPDKGTVAFCAGSDGWAFTLGTFAKMYASRAGVKQSASMKRLWRGFVKLCYNPIKQVMDACMNNDKDKLKLLAQLGVTLNSDEKLLMGESLMKHVMRTWLPASTALLEMMIHHLPSPAKAQNYRADILYTGPRDDQYARAIRNCDPEGPLMLYVSKMIQPVLEIGTLDKKVFAYYGRIFAGKMSGKMNVRVMGPKHVSGKNKEVYTRFIDDTEIWMGNELKPVDCVPCGNTVAMSFWGEDDVTKHAAIVANSTWTNETNYDAHPISAMKFYAYPVIRTAVHCKVASEHSKFVKGLEMLQESDLGVTYKLDEKGEYISSAGDPHLQLVDKFMDGVEFMKSHPSVHYRETVVGESSCTVKTPNNLNCLSMIARPMKKELVNGIEAFDSLEEFEHMDRAKFLSEKGLLDDDSKKILCFGPKSKGPNILVDKCEGLENNDLIKDAIITGFQWASEEGGLAGETMRGIYFEISDMDLAADLVNRGRGQFIAAARRAFYASQLSACPRLSEPIYLLEMIAHSPTHVDRVRVILSGMRGEIAKECRTGSVWHIEAHLPVREYVRFCRAIKESMAGKVYFPRMHCVNPFLVLFPAPTILSP